MIVWILIVISLDLLLIISFYKGYSQAFALIISYLIMLSSIGILYRIFKQMRVARIEKLEKEVKKLEEENEELKLVDHIQQTETNED